MTSWRNDDGAGDGEEWYEIQLSVPWIVAGASGVQDAINIAVAEVGKRTKSTKARSAEIIVQDVACPSCGYEMEAALCTTDFALVVLTVIVEMPAGSLEESDRIAKRELGVRMKDIPLTVLETRAVDEADEKPEMNFADLGREVPPRDSSGKEDITR
jgi:uncharacterized protein (UPF0212 family)